MNARLSSHSRPLHEADPEIARAIDLEVDRQARTVELIASENFVSEAVLEALGSVMTNKYAEGLARQALLRRLRVRGRGRESCHRARQEALWRGARQRPGALRQPGQSGRLYDRAETRRYAAVRPSTERGMPALGWAESGAVVTARTRSSASSMATGPTLQLQPTTSAPQASICGA